MKLPFIIVAAPLLAAAAPPSVDNHLPRGLQSGTECRVTFSGNGLEGATELLFSRPGLSSKDPVFEDEKKKSVSFTVVAEEGIPNGEYPFRLRTTGGLSYLKILKVGSFPEFDEEQTALPLSAENPAVTVNGTLTREEADPFDLQLTKGQTVSLELEGMRLGTHEFDPAITLLSPSGQTLAFSDDTTLLAQDPHLTFTAPEEGTYGVEVRDSSYDAAQDSPYRLHVGNFPRPTTIWPPGRTPGEGVVPDHTGVAEVYTSVDGIRPPSGNPVRVTEHAVTEEVEPNKGFDDATPTRIGNALHGRIDAPGEYDFFTFTAQKDTSYSLRAFASSLRSPADLVLDVFGPDKKYLKGNDDANGTPDADLTFKTGEEGSYYLRVRDYLKRHGPEYVYRIEIDEITPTLALSIPQFDRNESQERQTVPVPRGGRVATLLNIQHNATSGAVAFTAADLPPGVTLHAPELPEGATQVPVVFEATPDAGFTGKLVDLRAALTGHPEVNCGFTQKLDLPRPRNNLRPFRTLPLERLPLAVVEAPRFSIEVEPLKTPLVQRGSANFSVQVHRGEGFEGNVTLRLLGRPPGFGTNNTITVPKDRDSIEYAINANSTAAPGTWHLVIQAEAEGVLNASPLLPLTIETSYLELTAPLVITEQGGSAEMVCTVVHDREFEGLATAKLSGLPAHATAPPVRFSSGQETVTIPITTTAESPLGLSKNIRATVEIPHPTGTIVQTAYESGRLRIDPPQENPTPNLANQ